MPIDPNIVLQAGRVQAVDPLEAVGKAFSLRQLAQQSRMGALQEAHTRQQIAAGERATQQDAAFRAELGANDNPRGNQKLLSIDPKRALEVWKGLDEQQKAAIATEKEVSGRIASSAGAILGVGDDQLVAAYEQERAALLQTPAGQSAKIPPASAFPHPAALRSWLTIKQKAAQSAHEQITSAEKVVTAELQRQRDAEAVRHNKAGESHQTATLTETQRHNRAAEATAAANAAKKDYEWVSRNGHAIQIVKGTAQPGDQPYDATAARQAAKGDAGSEVADTYAAERRTRIREAITDLIGKKQTDGTRTGGSIGNLNTGVIGMATRNLPSTPSRKLATDLNELKANIAFNELQEMRNASKTGGALGGIAVQELEMLQSTLGSLDQFVDDADLTKRLENIEATIDRWEAAKAATRGTTNQTADATTGKVNPFLKKK